MLFEIISIGSLIGTSLLAKRALWLNRHLTAQTQQTIALQRELDTKTACEMRLSGDLNQVKSDNALLAAAVEEHKQATRSAIVSGASQAGDMLGQFLTQLAEQTALTKKLEERLTTCQQEKYAVFNNLTNTVADKTRLEGELALVRDQLRGFFEDNKLPRMVSHKPAPSVVGQ